MPKFDPPIRFMATISKRFTFDAAHYLPTVPEGHKCRRMHGHTYGVEIILSGEVGNTGFVEDIDYDDITNAWKEIHAQIDHRTLNDIPGLEIPSTEIVALWIMRALYKRFDTVLQRIVVSESATTWCEVHRHQLESVLLQESIAGASR